MSNEYSFADLSDELLDRSILASAGRKHSSSAQLLAFIAEYDHRQRHVALGYESLRAFCEQALHLTPDSGYKRIQAARVAREFPALFPALADGRLNLTAVNLLAPYLSAETADELIAAATYKSKAEIRQLLAERFPKEQPSRMSLLPATIRERHPMESGTDSAESASGCEEGSVTSLAPAQVEEVDCWARITPLSGDRYSVSLTIDRATHELWRHNQSMLSHQIPSGNLAEVLRRALAESALQFEKRKFRASANARRATGCRKPGSRYVPKHVRDEVWRRDGGTCTFVGETGHRCGSRTRLELDHIVPVARGGASAVDNLRLRCRVHNQLEAERVLGADFMKHKREQARVATQIRETAQSRETARTRETAGVPETAVAREAGVAPAAATDPVAPGPTATPPNRNWIAEARTRASAAGLLVPRDPDVVSALRQLGMRADQARALAKVCDTIPEAPFQERLRVALSFHGSTVAKPVRVTEASAMAAGRA